MAFKHHYRTHIKFLRYIYNIHATVIVYETHVTKINHLLTYLLTNMSNIMKFIT